MAAAIVNQRQRVRITADAKAVGSVWYRIAPKTAKVHRRNVLLMEEDEGAHFLLVVKVRKAAPTTARLMVEASAAVWMAVERVLEEQLDCARLMEAGDGAVLINVSNLLQVAATNV